MALEILRWMVVLVLAYLTGRLVQHLHLPAILGWLIAGMAFGPYGFSILSNEMMGTRLYTWIIDWMQVAFGLMLGTELVFRKLKKTGRALVVTTLFQSLGTFVVVTVAFAVAFAIAGVPLYLSMVFGSIALATAPAPALSIVREYHTKGPVTDTLLPMSVLDDVVGIIVFFSVNAIVTGRVSGGSFPLWLIPVMILLPTENGVEGRNACDGPCRHHGVEPFLRLCLPHVCAVPFAQLHDGRRCLLGDVFPDDLR